MAEVWQARRERFFLLVALTAKGRCQGSSSEFSVDVALVRQVPVIKIVLIGNQKCFFFFSPFSRLSWVSGCSRPNVQ